MGQPAEASRQRVAESEAITADPAWKSLYRIGAIAALIAALVFRRNLGVAEVPLFTGLTFPSTVAGWFALLTTTACWG
jgi:hypothetical protein